MSDSVVTLRLTNDKARQFRALEKDAFFLISAVSRRYGLSTGVRMRLVYDGTEEEGWEVLVVGTQPSKQVLGLDDILVSKDPDRTDANGSPWYPRV